MGFKKLKNIFGRLSIKGPLQLAKFAIASVGQDLCKYLCKYLYTTLYKFFILVEFSFRKKLFFHSSYAVLTCTRNGRNSFTSDFNNC